MFTEFILFAVLAAFGIQSNPATASDEPLPNAPIPIDHVTVEQSADSAHVLGYGEDGQIAIELVIWRTEGEPRLAATRPDGAYVFVSLHDGEASIDSHDSDSVEAQLVELDTALDVDAETEQAGWLDCALAAGGAVGSAIAVSPWCPFAMAIAACQCLPELVDEFEPYHCPGMG